MTESQREQVDDLFGDLLEQEPSTWPAAIAAIDDPEVRAQVQLLLRHSSPATKGLDAAIGDVMRAATVSGAFDDRAIGPGTRFERYSIQRKIGQGGMGDVYEASRENDFHKRVALKIVRYGLDSDFARGRFQQERQTLALLEHPFIARLLDGGEAENGCPYLVLEFVDGVPIDIYSQGRPQQEILKLFLKVCAAVEYAHRNLVIHRDLKPANILVTPDGDPKLLDFGIAKLLSPDPAAAANVTQTVAVALTPQYASPEQVRNQPITTASDVYSLGVILYQLLTGRKPYQVETTTALELERVVCEEPPGAPGIGNELDDILMMALRKEPERRYAGVAQFAQDIQRFLDGDAVSAAPDTLRYRSGKFLRRHKIGIAALAAVILALAGGLVSTLYQMRRAEREQRQAEQRFQQVRKLANTFLFDFHDQIVNVPGTTKARELVVKTALEYLDNLSKSAGSDPVLQAEVAQAYSRVADAQGAPRRANLGDRAGAETNYKRASRIYEPLLKRYPVYTADIVQNEVKLANFYMNDKRGQDAQAALDHAFLLAEPLKKENSATALRTLSTLYSAAGSLQGMLADKSPSENYDLNVKYLRQSLQYLDRWSAIQQGGDPATIAATVGKEHLRVGRAFIGLSRLTEAEEEIKTADAYLSKAFTLQPLNLQNRLGLYSAKASLGALYSAQSVPHLERFAESAVLSREAIELLRPLIEAEATDMHSRAQTMRLLVTLAYSTVRAKQGTGIAEMQRAMALREEISHAPTASVNDLTGILDDFRLGVQVFALNGLNAEAHALAARNLRERRVLLAGKAPGDDDLWYLVADLQVAAEAARAAGAAAEADRLYAEAIRTAAPFAGAADRIVPTAYVAADFYAALRRDRAATGRCAEAAEWQAKETVVWQFLAPTDGYAAMRLKQAQNQPKPCSQKSRNLFFD